MAKPTLLQTLLGRPSQRYTTPAPKQYYSEKLTLMRLAAAKESNDDHAPVPPADDDEAASDSDDVFYTPRSSMASDMSMTLTAPSTSDHVLYTDQDWAKELQWLAIKPKRAVIPIAPRASRSPTPSIMMSMTAVLEEDEDPAVPPKLTPPPSGVIISGPAAPARPRSSHSRSSSSSAVHRRSRSLGTKGSPLAYTPPPLPSGPPELPSYGTPAYTSLTVPPAPLSSLALARSTSISQRIKASLRRETADLSRSRLAQATMATIEVVGGLAAPSSDQPPRLGFTHYRAPPTVSKSSVLVQVWAVGLETVDLRLLDGSTTPHTELMRPRTQSIGRFVGRQMSISRRAASDGASEKETKSGHSRPQVGFIPGRSFVGRVLECGWEVCDEVARRGEWVVGLLDVRKSGALAEFITADRHRIHRVPHPQSHANGSRPTAHSSSDGHLYSHSNQYPSRPSSISFRETPRSSRQYHRKTKSEPPAAAPPPGPTLEELALLPFALTAYRAVRTLVGLEGFGTGVRISVGAVSPEGEPEVDPMSEERHRKSRLAAGRRALVLNGHSGTGAFVARMLAARGWRVCVHAPGTLSDAATGCTEADKAHMATVQARTRAWGVEEVVFDDGGGVGDGEDWGQGAAVRAIEQLIEDGDAFDAVVDTIGGRTVWEAGQRLLVCAADGGRKQFTTTVGDSPERPVPSAMDNFRLGLRAMRGSQSESTKKEKGSKARTNVSYAWVSVAQDVDWEGGDVRDGLGVLVQMALEAGMRPVVENQLPFERAVDVFEGREDPAMRHGGSVVVKVVG